MAPSTFRYSGTATAVASGDLPPHAGTIDVARLATDAGVRHLEGRIVAMDRHAKRVEVHDGRRRGYDVASFNVGSVPETRGVTVGEGVIRVKPMEELATLAGRLALLRGAGPVRVGVVGSGASGLEVAGHVARRLTGQGTVVVFERDPVPAGFLVPGARHAALRRLVLLGVTFHVGVTVAEVAADRVALADGRAVACDLTVLATGLVANPIVQQLGLGDHQGMPVRPTLQHVDDEDVLAAGDCAHFLAAPLPNLGVHGVRQGPVLLEGLLARNVGESLPAYRPPRVTLQVLDLGSGRGLATRGRWWWYGAGPACSSASSTAAGWHAIAARRASRRSARPARPSCTDGQSRPPADLPTVVVATPTGSPDGLAVIPSGGAPGAGGGRERHGSQAAGLVDRGPAARRADAACPERGDPGGAGR